MTDQEKQKLLSILYALLQGVQEANPGWNYYYLYREINDLFQDE